MNPEQIANFLKELKSPEDLASFVKALQLKQGGAKVRDVGDRGPIRRTFGFQIKADTLDEKKRAVRVIASTAALDSYDEIVDQSWRLERYRANPVVLYGHNRVGFLGMGGDPNWTLPVGFATQVATGENLEATLNFVDEAANPLAVKVWEQFRQGGMRAVSVGFYPHTVTKETHNDIEVYRLSDNELFEISAVPLPANPEAVALSAERTAEREWFRARSLTISLPVPAAKTAQEKTMDIETLKQALKIAEESIASKNAELTARTTELTARSAELTAKSAELASTLERVKALETELAATTKSLTESQTKVGELEAEAKVKDAKLAQTETDAQLAEVKALVGKKFGPGELEAMIELRSSNPALFTKTMAGRPDMVHGEDITGKDKNALRSMAKGGNGAIAKRAREEANKAQADAK